MSLSDTDTEAISKAISILSHAGFDVQKVNQGTSTESGVAFKLEMEAPTRYPKFAERAEWVKGAAQGVPDLGMDADPIEEEPEPGPADGDPKIVREGTFCVQVQELSHDDLPYRARLVSMDSWHQGTDLAEAARVAVGVASIEEGLGDIWEPDA